MSNATHSSTPSNPSDHACLDLINSWFTDHLGTGNDVDRIASQEWQRWFLKRHGLGPHSRAAPMEDLVRLRRDLRRLLDNWSQGVGVSVPDAHLLDRLVRDTPIRQRITATPTGIATRREPLHMDWTWVIANVTGSAIELLISGDPKRLKTCTNPACSWMFYDDTINRSKLFCSTSPCASLVRVRRFRQRT